MEILNIIKTIASTGAILYILLRLYIVYERANLDKIQRKHSFIKEAIIIAHTCEAENWDSLDEIGKLLIQDQAEKFGFSEKQAYKILSKITSEQLRQVYLNIDSKIADSNTRKKESNSTTNKSIITQSTYSTFHSPLIMKNTMGTIYMPTYPTYTSNTFAENAENDPLGFMDQFQTYAIDLPLKYFFIKEELSSIAISAVATWQFMHAMHGSYSCEHPFYDDPYNVSLIADFMKKIGEEERAELLHEQKNQIFQISCEEMDAYLRFNGEVSVDRSEQIERMFYMHADLYRDSEWIEKTTKKIAKYILEHEVISYIDRGRLEKEVSIYIDKIPNYFDRLAAKADKFPNSIYSLLLEAKERLHHEAVISFKRDLDKKELNVDKYITSGGDRLFIQYADLHQLMDQKTGKIIVEKSVKRQRINEPLWYFSEAPKWSYDENTRQLMLAELNN